MKPVCYVSASDYRVHWEGQAPLIPLPLVRLIGGYDGPDRRLGQDRRGMVWDRRLPSQHGRRMHTFGDRRGRTQS